MTAQLTLTTAGASAVADGANIGLSEVTFTRLALGSGTGAGDQSARVALETQRDIEAVTGVPAPAPGRIPIRADYIPSEVYAVTEVGLFARIGAGAEFLCAYWIAESAANAVASAAVNTTLIIAGIIEVQSAGADIAIAPAVNISIGAPANVVYTDRHATEGQRGIIEIATQGETNTGADDERAVTALKLAERLAAYATRVWVATQLAALNLASYATRAWVLMQLNNLPAAQSVPTGTILDFGGTAAPVSYSLCDGGTLSRAGDAALYSVIGTTYGTGDGATTFNKPDFRRRVAVGVGGGGTAELPSTAGSIGGAETHVLTAGQMPRHSHSSGSYAAANAGGHSHGGGSYAAASAGGHSHSSGSYEAASAGEHSHSSGSYAATTAGEHTHSIRTALDSVSVGANNISVASPGSPTSGLAVPAGNHSHDVRSGSSGSTGDHSHDVSGSSGSTGDHSHDVSGSSGSIGDHSHDVAGNSGKLGKPPARITSSSRRWW